MSDEKAMAIEAAWTERDAAHGRLLAAKDAYRVAVRRIRAETDAFNRADVLARKLGPRPTKEQS